MTITDPILPNQLTWPSIPPLVVDPLTARGEAPPVGATVPPTPPTCGRHWAVVYGKYDPLTDTHPTIWQIPRPVMIRCEWERVRDDPSRARVDIGYASDCIDQVASLNVINQNIGIYREGILVYFGVITRLEFEEARVEIYAEDMLWFMRRRVLNPGYDNATVGVNAIDHVNFMLWQSYFSFGFNPQGMVSASEPYILPVLQTDAEKSNRAVNNWQITVHEDLEHQSQYTNIDYSTFGKAIYFWDFNTRWTGLDLPDLLESDVSSFPRVTQYGNAAYTRAIRTDGSGYAGLYDEFSTPGSTVTDEYFRNIDFLMGNSEPNDRDGPPSADTIANWERVAKKTLSGRLPNQELVAIPNGTTLMPSCTWNIDYTLAGSWFSITVARAGRVVTSLLRLQSLRVVETGEEGERISITTTAAPDDWVTPT